MIQFANPLWLWGFLGLAIPVAIHLLSRKEGKVIPIGSLRHLTESDTARFASIRLNEVLLLIVRCFLIASIVLYLAGTRLTGWNDTATKWLVLEKGVEDDHNMKYLIDSLGNEGYETRLLAPGFPVITDSASFAGSIDYWTLSEELQSRKDDEIVVISYNYTYGFRGKRPAAGSNLRWITADVIPQPARHVKAVAIGRDSAWTRTMESSTLLSKLRTRIQLAKALDSSTPIEKADTIRISIRADNEFSNDSRIMRACFLAIAPVIPYHIELATGSADTTDAHWIVWLSAKELPATSSHTIVYKNCPGTALPLIVSATRGAIACGGDADPSGWIVTKRLSEEIALSENLALTIASILLKEKAPESPISDNRTLASASMWSKGTDYAGRVRNTDATTIDLWLALVVILLLAGERYLSFRRNQ